MDDKIKYTGLKLTPNVFKDLLIELYDGKQFTRQDAISNIIECFASKGGVVENKSYIASFKRATQLLQGQGIENKGYGVWALKYEKKTVEIVEEKKYYASL